MTRQVAVSGSFDDLRSRDVRFLETASALGRLTVLLWTDDLIWRLTRKPPKFPETERLYFLQAIRYVAGVQWIDTRENEDALNAPADFHPDVWAVSESEHSIRKKQFCDKRHMDYRMVSDAELVGISIESPSELTVGPGRKTIIVTGCYDWLHSGHVRFFEEVSTYGELYVVVGNDVNIQLLKGAGHPLLPEAERRYMVHSIRYVKQALVSSGQGWLDAEPEIQRLKPDIYAVNHDGDRGGKREYCLKHGIEYLVLERTPAPGLPQRTSTNLRGF